MNTAESLHGILKRAIMGVWRWISDKHTGRYLSISLEPPRCF